MTRIPQLSFASGELTPLIDARSDLEKYHSGARTMLNMLPRIYGIAERRPGTEYIAEVKDSPKSCRMIPFIYSSTVAYMLEFGDLYFRVYYDGAQLTDTAGSAIEVTTPYGLADLEDLHVEQIGDVMRLSHPRFQQRKIERTTATTFTISAIAHTKGPFQKRNDLANADDVTMTSSVTTGTGTLTCSTPYFTSNHVGAIFQLTHPRATAEVTQSGAGSSSAIDVFGSATWTTTGTWTGTVRLERNENSEGWETYRTQTSTDDDNIKFSFTEKEANVQYRATVVAGVTGTCNTIINVHDSTQKGIVRVDSYTSRTVVGITVLEDVAAVTATKRWAEGCWSDHAGWPGAMTLHDNRIWYAGTDTQPTTIWGSEVDDYEDFREGTETADSFAVQMQSTNRIIGLGSLEGLAIFTAGDEWRMQSNKLDTPISPTNFSLKQQTEFGGSTVQPVKIGPVIMFLDSVNRKIREFTYSDQQGKYVAPDMTALAEHISQTGIYAFAHQKTPDSILWGVRRDGTVVSMVYDREQDTVAWSRHLVADSNVDTSENNYDLVQDAAAQSTAQTTAITNVTELQAMNDDLAGNYYLANDIDGSATKDWANGGFIPIGDPNGTKFTGTFDGNGYTISDLTTLVADFPNAGGDARSKNNVGLFGGTNGATIHSFTLENYTITMGTGVAGGGTAGMVVGLDSTASTFQDIIVKNCTLEFNNANNGGFAGQLSGSTIIACRVEGMTLAEQSGNNRNAGPMGLFMGDSNLACTVTDCFANGTIPQSTIAGGTYTALGGFVGSSNNGDAYTRCHVTGSMPLNSTSANNAAHNDTTYGGFCGDYNATGTFTDCTFQDTMNHLPFNGEDETQTVDFDAPNPTGGTYTLSYDGTTTAALAYNASAATIQTALDDAFGAKFLEIENTPMTTMEVWFRGAGSTRTDVALMTMDVSNLTGGAGTVTIAQSNAAVYSVPGTVPTARSSDDTGSAVNDVVPQTGTIQSIAVIPGRPGPYREDEVWANVRLLVNDRIKSFIVRFKPRNWGTALEDAFFVDCGLTITNSPESTTVSGLDHLEGETVKVLADGTEQTPTAAVSSGSITLPTAATKIQVGLPYRYTLKPVKPIFTGQGGTTLGSKAKVAEMLVSFYRTLGAQYGIDTDNLYEIDWTYVDWENNTDVTGLFTGEVPLHLEGGFNRDVDLVISDNGVHPCIVRAMVPILEITGR